MVYRVVYMLVFLILILSHLGCAQPTSPGGSLPRSGSGWQGPDAQSPTMVMHHLGNVDLTDPDNIENYAKADMVTLDITQLWSPLRNHGAVDALKSVNPDIKVIGYISAHSCWLHWGDDPEIDPIHRPFGWDWYQATRPFWSYTTEGDTMMAWPGKVLLNILDPDCRASMIDVLVSHRDRYSNRLDGFFWDHFNNHLWVPDSIPNLVGQLDLDGDGIPHRSDEDEMQAYREASSFLVQEFSSAFGSGVIQIVNGNRAATDSTFASYVDGMFYEYFPDVGFYGTAMEQCLDPGRYNNLFTARSWPRNFNGGPWLILSNKMVISFMDSEGVFYSYRLAEFARVIALLTGTAVCYNSYDVKYHYGWPEVELQLGSPLGGVERSGDTITRSFESGRVTLNMTSGEMPLPFDFEIVQDGQIVQSFAYPQHYP